MKKFLSRKFLISLAAFLGSIGTSIAALRTENSVVAVVGVVCAMFSAAIYAACEAKVDAADCGGDTMIVSEDDDAK